MAITPPQTGSSHVGFEDDLELPPDRLERHSSVSTGLKNYSKWRMVRIVDRCIRVLKLYNIEYWLAWQGPKFRKKDFQICSYETALRCCS